MTTPNSKEMTFEPRAFVPGDDTLRFVCHYDQADYFVMVRPSVVWSVWQAHLADAPRVPVYIGAVSIAPGAERSGLIPPAVWDFIRAQIRLSNS